MKIFALVNQKGGVSKTTISMAMASYLVMAGKKTLLVDCDPQGSLEAWYRRQGAKSKLKELKILKVKEPGELRELYQLDYEYVILDTPGHNSPMADAIIKTHADALLVPLKSSLLDFAAFLEGSEDELSTHAKIKETGKPFSCVITQVSSDKEARIAKEALDEMGVPVLANHFKNLIEWKKALEIGETPFSISRYSNGGMQINNLCNEIFGDLK